MWAKWLGALIGEIVFLQSYMAGCAAIHNLLLRDPDLLDATLKAPL